MWRTLILFNILNLANSPSVEVPWEGQRSVCSASCGPCQCQASRKQNCVPGPCCRWLVEFQLPPDENRAPTSTTSLAQLSPGSCCHQKGASPRDSHHLLWDWAQLSSPLGSADLGVCEASCLTQLINCSCCPVAVDTQWAVTLLTLPRPPVCARPEWRAQPSARGSEIRTPPPQVESEETHSSLSPLKPGGQGMVFLLGFGWNRVDVGKKLFCW